MFFQFFLNYSQSIVVYFMTVCLMYEIFSKYVVIKCFVISRLFKISLLLLFGQQFINREVESVYFIMFLEKFLRIQSNYIIVAFSDVAQSSGPQQSKIVKI